MKIDWGTWCLLIEKVRFGHALLLRESIKDCDRHFQTMRNEHPSHQRSRKFLV